MSFLMTGLLSYETLLFGLHMAIENEQINIIVLLAVHLIGHTVYLPKNAAQQIRTAIEQMGDDLLQEHPVLAYVCQTPCLACDAPSVNEQGAPALQSLASAAVSMPANKPTNGYRVYPRVNGVGTKRERDTSAVDADDAGTNAKSTKKGRTVDKEEARKKCRAKNLPMVRKLEKFLDETYVVDPTMNSQDSMSVSDILREFAETTQVDVLTLGASQFGKLLQATRWWSEQRRKSRPKYPFRRIQDLDDDELEHMQRPPQGYLGDSDDDDDDDDQEEHSDGGVKDGFIDRSASEGSASEDSNADDSSDLDSRDLDLMPVPDVPSVPTGNLFEHESEEGKATDEAADTSDVDDLM